MRVSQFLIVVPLLMQAVLSLMVVAIYWRRRLLGAPHERLAACYRSQFELPVLFYAGALSAFAMRIVDEWVLFFGMLFVLSEAVVIVAMLALESRKVQVSASLVAVTAAAMLWATIALQFIHSGF